MELRQYLCMRREDIMEQLYILMEDLITQILKVVDKFMLNTYRQLGIFDAAIS